MVSTIPDVVEGLFAGRAPRTARAYRADLDDFARWRGLPLVAAIAQLLDAGEEEGGRTMRRFAGALQREGRAPATIDRRLGTLRLLLHRAVEGGLIDWTVEVNDWASVNEDMEVHGDDVAYVLPRHPAEVDRLDLQHYALVEATGVHHFAPVERLDRVLDVGAGTGQWGCDVRKHSRAEVFGFDLVRPKAGMPEGYHAVRGNLLRGLPFVDDSFDLVHQRLLFTGIPVDAWPETVRELVRVCRPGGWVELVEGATCSEPAGPAMRQLVELLLELNRSTGLDTSSVVHDSLDRFLMDAGLDRVERRTIRMPLGEWGGKVGSLMASDVRSLFTRLGAVFAARLGVRAAQCVELVRAAQVEWEELRTTYSFAMAWGQKA